ncbi:glycosyl transferase, group 1 [Roseibacterium elongatum DSM 19469]|uniref:Glycosyl transferase, group 1 n=1 Tax=Roseicyclus elongatus DSM 19469 TaxID=1294273 RepID=W8SM09_9RHOB|nr:glycosyltransferase [Roseibacterium elongatum]AHM03570.1 glycosyl transferase, group 1 [Roseibacterium elongatum DSM 19469]
MHLAARGVENRAIHFYLPSFEGGGAERFFVRLANHIASRGIPVHLVVNNDNGPVKDLLSEKVDLHVLGSRKAVLCLPKLVAHLKETQAQTLISALTRTNVAALVAARLARTGTRVIVCERNQYTALLRGMDPLRRVAMNALVRHLYPKAHAVIGNTDLVTRDIAEFASLPKEATGVIHNAAPDAAQLDDARAAPTGHPWFDDDKPTAIAIGRLMPQKDYATMLRAVAQSGSDLRLIILGEGPERQKLEDLARELGIEDRVDFLGYRMDRFRYLVAADLFIISSVTEGFPNALIEAVAAGIPAISTDCLGGGAREILGREFPDRITPIGDPEAMAMAIRSVLDAQDAASLNLQSERIARIAERYQMSEVADAFLARAWE